MFLQLDFLSNELGHKGWVRWIGKPTQQPCCNISSASRLMSAYFWPKGSTNPSVSRLLC